MCEERLDGHVLEHIAPLRRRSTEIADLALTQIQRPGADLPLLVPGAVLMADRDDARRAMRVDEGLEPAREEVEVLGHEIEQREWLDAARHSNKVRARAGLEVLTRELVK